MTHSTLIAGVVAFLAASVATRLAERIGRRRQILDMPNERSSHVIPTPRIGGVGLVAGVVAGWIAASGWDDGTGTTVLAAATALAIVGLADDLGHSSVAGKYLAQLATSLLAAVAVGPELTASFGGGTLAITGTPAVIIAAIWLTAVINAFNFIDGIDGMLGSAAAVIATGGVLLTGDSLPLAVAAGACLGFLIWNLAPASIFMGDVGSQFLGLLIGASLLRHVSGAVDVVPIAILSSVLLADTGYTLVRRALAGRDLFAAHREHLYQRLVTAGRSHREVSALYAAGTAAAALAALAWTSQVLALHVAVVIGLPAAFVGLVRWVRAVEHSESDGGVPQPER